MFDGFVILFNPEVEEMLDPEMSDGDDVIERAPALMAQDSQGQTANVDVRRRIEQIRELKRLRELLDDPNFDELG